MQAWIIFSPYVHPLPRLLGFMTEQQYLSCLHYQMISEDGGVVPMPVPIVLPVTDDTKAKLEGKSSIALKKPSGEVAESRMSCECEETLQESEYKVNPVGV